ncbi:hypothetical protein M5K25_002960 [Dendrobium thyrsiflorum]|uniref:Reverse transcriptase zinc-binding domain-containing protein n=1 Tax=Dendrobium thyrsiflorum TaxID=117978 RepID=A0ABD0VPK9_DENTH
MWMLETNFFDMVQENWDAPLHPNNNILGMLRLAYKLKRLKFKLNWWNRCIFKNLFAKILAAEDLVNNLEIKCQENPSVQNRFNFQEAKINLFHLQDLEEIFWKQKAASTHLLEGDKNTRYFHTMVNNNRAKRFIHRIVEEDGSIIEGNDNISTSAVTHFTRILNNNFQPANIDLPNLIPKLINEQENTALTMVPSLEEIKHTVTSMNGDSVAGPEGFTTKFFQNAWSIVGMDVAVSHLLFADDVIIFANGAKNKVKMIMDVLKKFENTSGLNFNVKKSDFVTSTNMSQARINEIKNTTGFNHGLLPLKYLGIPLFKGRKRSFLFDDLISKVQKKLNAWNSHLLSFGGKSSNNKIMWTTWNNCCGVIDEGGLGCKSLHDLAKAFSYKLWFKFRYQNCMWSKFMKNKYCPDSHPSMGFYKQGNSRIWKRLCDIKWQMEPHISWELGVGNVFFWQDKWLNNHSVDQLINSTSNSNMKVSQVVTNNSWDYNKLREMLPDGIVQDILTIPCNRQNEDKLKCEFFKLGKFCMKRAWHTFRRHQTARNFFTLIWHRNIPSTASVFLWRLWNNFVPTDDILIKKGLYLVSKCQCCYHVENYAHIFISNPIAVRVWIYFEEVFHLKYFNANFTIRQVVTKWFSKSRGNITHLICALILLNLWFARNNSRFNSIPMDANRIIKDIKDKVYRLFKGKLLTAKNFKNYNFCANDFGIQLVGAFADMRTTIVRWRRRSERPYLGNNGQKDRSRRATKVEKTVVSSLKANAFSLMLHAILSSVSPLCFIRSKTFQTLLRKGICSFVQSQSLLPPPPALNFSEEVILEATIINLYCCRWHDLEKLSPAMTDNIVRRVILQCQQSPQQALYFFQMTDHNRQQRNLSPLCLDINCLLIHVLIAGKMFDESLNLMKKLMQQGGIAPLNLLDSLGHVHANSWCKLAAYDALVRACTQLRASSNAHLVIKTLRGKGIMVSIHAWNNFLNCVLMLRQDVNEFWMMYDEMLAFGYVENMNTFNLAILAFCREFRLLEAFSVFSRLIKKGIEPNIVTLNMIVDGCCRKGDIALAFELISKFSDLFRSRIEPNCVTYNSLVNGLSKAGEAAVGERLLRVEMMKWGIKPNLRTYATLVDGFARQRKMDEALRLFNEMLDRGLIPNSIVYNSLINCFLKQGSVEYAWNILSSMIETLVFPDNFTYSILVEGCLRNGFVKEAFQYHHKMREEVPIRDTVSYNILINYLCKHSKIKEAKQLLASMITSGLFPDVITYTTLINGCCKRYGVDDALQIYDGMVKYNQKPNLVTYNTILNGLCKEDSIEVASFVMDEMIRAGLYVDVIAYNTLMNAYCRKEYFDKAFSLYLQMRRHGIMETEATYNVLINFLCKSGFFQLAKDDLLKEMLDRGILPDQITYTILMTLFSRHCSSNEVIELHDFLVLRGVIPDENTYNCIVSPLLERGNVYEKVRVARVAEKRELS